MKKLLLTSALLLAAIGTQAQSKTTGTVTLMTGMTAELLLNNTTTTATLTLAGPSDRWFALQFGSFTTGEGMQQGEDMVYFNGTTLIDANMNGIGNFPSTDTNNWTVVSNTVTGTTRTVVATRAFAGGTNDYTFVYADANIDFAYSRSGTATFNLGSHSGNRGYSLNRTFTTVLSTDGFSLEGLSVYPNPALDNVTINNKTQLAHVTVINLLGQEVLYKETNNTTVTVNIQDLKAGTYIVKVTAADGRTASQKIIKE